VVGLDQSAATAQLTAFGLIVTTIEQPVPAGDPTNGKVVAQSIAGGTNVEPGSAVTITVGRADTTTTIP
jgi:beta-lactam-binding protein with PASTA domain